jgi:hypothetical protein
MQPQVSRSLAGNFSEADHPFEKSGCTSGVLEKQFSGKTLEVIGKSKGRACKGFAEYDRAYLPRVVWLHGCIAGVKTCQINPWFALRENSGIWVGTGFRPSAR